MKEASINIAYPLKTTKSHLFFILTPEFFFETRGKDKRMGEKFGN